MLLKPNMSNVSLHLPVLLPQILEKIGLRPDGIYIDCTFGRGGHSRAILEQLDRHGQLLALDKDPDAVQMAQELCQLDPRFQIVHSSFSQLANIVQSYGWQGKINGVLLDLGVSSPQLDVPQRGFSFLHDGPLDMRMNPNEGQSVATWLATAKVQEIADVFKTYGEERYARRIANAIVEARQQTALTTTRQLAEIIAKAHPAWEMDKHPATRCFLALRIFINRELDELQQVLPQLVEILAPTGRMVVISFHSLEDRMVKRFIRHHSRGDDFPPQVPVPVTALHPTLKTIGKPIFPSDIEISSNPRARSAVLRVAEKL